jgi:serine/threonine protein phosphatase PrpC
MNSNPSKTSTKSKQTPSREANQPEKKKLSVKVSSSKEVIPSFYTKASKPNSTIIKACHSLSKDGKDDSGKPKKNQDTYLIIRDLLQLENVNIFAVMDGHGEHGEQVSGQIKRFFLSQFNNNKVIIKVKNADELYTALSTNNFELLRQLFKDAEKSLSKCNIDYQLSGTTCVMVIQIGRRLISANVGDSRCIFINGDNSIKELSRDHKPDLADEKERITSKGGEIAQFEDNGVKSGPFRIWCKGHSYPGIAMSRSIGDKIASELGVICDPEIIEYEIPSDAKFMILASDGIWEFLDNEKVKDIVMPCYTNNNAESACSTLIKKAVECWLGEDVCVDDITVVTVFF